MDRKVENMEVTHKEGTGCQQKRRKDNGEGRSGHVLGKSESASHLGSDSDELDGSKAKSSLHNLTNHYVKVQ